MKTHSLSWGCSLRWLLGLLSLWEVEIAIRIRGENLKEGKAAPAGSPSVEGYGGFAQMLQGKEEENVLFKGPFGLCATPLSTSRRQLHPVNHFPNSFQDTAGPHWVAIQFKKKNILFLSLDAHQLSIMEVPPLSSVVGISILAQSCLCQLQLPRVLQAWWCLQCVRGLDESQPGRDTQLSP